VRDDLLALTDDDLASYANRGVVRRARREQAAGEGPEVTIAAGTLTALARDGATTVLDAGATLEEARCDCPAPGVCRHVVALVLAAQEAAGTAAAPPAAAAPPPPSARPWDPGSIGDDDLEASARPRTLAAARRASAGGQTWWLVRGVKPVAELLDEGVSVRFLVEGDVRYARCECPDPAPCVHALGAVLAFRVLRESASAGTVETARGAAAAVDGGALDELEAAVRALVEAGARTAALEGVLRRAGARCAAAGLTWPADVAVELADAVRAWARADATFADDDLARLAGEALVRIDALRADTGAVPRLVVAGPADAVPRPVRGARLIGLGCSVRTVRDAVEVRAHLADADTGRRLALVRRFDRPAADTSFARMATARRSGTTPAEAGRGQVVATGGTRAPTGVLDLGRRPASVVPQAFAFDATLHPAVLAAGAGDAAARIAAEPPPAVAARGPGRGLLVVPVARVLAAGFAVAEHAVVVRAEDAAGAPVVVRHAYATRGAGGVEALLAALEGPEALRWVAGFARAAGEGVELRPTGLVFEAADGTRRMVQPWVDPAPGDAAGPVDAPAAEGEPGADPGPLADLDAALGELLVAGAARADAATVARWDDLAARFDALGSTRLHPPVARLATVLARRRSDPAWSPAEALGPALELLALAALAR
jgi:hypothetical protein